MKRNTKITIAVCGVIVIIVLIIAIGMIIRKKMNTGVSDESGLVESTSDTVIKNGKVSLYTLANSEEEGRDIAKKLDITFESYSYGVATFLTDKNPSDVISKAQELNLPDISINTYSYIDEK